MTRVTYNNSDNPHEEVASVERVIRSHINWAVNNKDRATLPSTVVSNEELFFYQTDSAGTVKGFQGLQSGEPMVWENVRWTGVLENIAGDWKIFHMHFSKAEDQVD